MNLQKVESVLFDIFGQDNVKSYTRGFRIIVEYDNMPYCIVLRLEENKLVIDRDAVDQDENNYEQAYKKAYKMLLKNKDKFDDNIDI